MIAANLCLLLLASPAFADPAAPPRSGPHRTYRTGVRVAAVGAGLGVVGSGLFLGAFVQPVPPGRPTDVPGFAELGALIGGLGPVVATSGVVAMTFAVRDAGGRVNVLPLGLSVALNATGYALLFAAEPTFALPMLAAGAGALLGQVMLDVRHVEHAPFAWVVTPTGVAVRGRF